MASSSLLSTAINVSIHEPVFVGARQLRSITREIDGYDHSINADGGFWSANVSLKTSITEAEEWIEKGLARHIRTVSKSGAVVWEGFVNRMTISLGGLSVSVGPLFDIANKVKTSFTFSDPTGIIRGLELQTAWSSDEASQARYGIIEEIYTVESATPTLAEIYRDTYLEERAQPATTKDFVSGQGSSPTVTLECLGYVHWLGAYFYVNPSTSTLTVSEKIADVITDDPNSLLSQDVSGITTNAQTVPSHSEDKRAWDVIKSLVAIGDSSANRWLFGVYANRRPTYAVAPTEVEYRQQLRDPAQRVTTVGGAVLDPWEVLPGKWLRFSDILVGRRSDDGDLSTLQNCMFIESVSYRAPWSLRLNGARDSRLDQRLGRLGLMGVGGMTGVAQ